MRHAPHIEINMMRIQVITDVARTTRPGAERLQLRLGLAHERREKTEVAQLANAIPGVRINWVLGLVYFHRDELAAPPRVFSKRQVFAERLHDRVRNQYMQPALHGFQGYSEMRIV